MISLGLQRFTCFNRWASVGIPTAISSETSAAHVSCAHRTCHTNRFRNALTNGFSEHEGIWGIQVCSLSPFLVSRWLPLVPSAEVVVSLSLRLSFFFRLSPWTLHPSHFLSYNLKQKTRSWILSKHNLSFSHPKTSVQLRLASPFCWPSSAHPLLSASAQRNNFRSLKHSLIWEAQTLLQNISSLRMALGKAVLPETRHPLCNSESLGEIIHLHWLAIDTMDAFARVWKQPKDLVRYLMAKVCPKKWKMVDMCQPLPSAAKLHYT